MEKEKTASKPRSVDRVCVVSLTVVWALIVLETAVCLASFLWHHRSLETLRSETLLLEKSLGLLGRLCPLDSDIPVQVLLEDASGSEGDATAELQETRRKENYPGRKVRAVNGADDLLQTLFKAQANILEHACETHPNLCREGPKGDPGPVGPTGPIGNFGEAGDRGPPGNEGLLGRAGPPGVVGPLGPLGEEGDQGPPGRKGDPGLPGEVGPQGERGDQGPLGEAGMEGSAGVKGDVGQRAPPGVRGGFGEAGPPGQKGDMGPPGAKGEPGDSGPPGSLLDTHCSCEVIPTVNASFPDVVNAPLWLPLSLVCGPGAVWERVDRPSPSPLAVQAGTLSFPAFQRQDEGTYRCVVHSNHFNASRSVKVVLSPPTPFDCDFEGKPCLWLNEANSDDFDWLRHSGPTGTGGTGPSDDHTLRDFSGNYMYVESSPPRKGGDTADLVSPFVSAHHRLCLAFWFHMQGRDMGSLSVIMQEPGQPDSMLWVRQGDQGSDWHLALVDVTPQAVAPRLRLRATLGPSTTSDIGLDDIALVDGACP